MLFSLDHGMSILKDPAPTPPDDTPDDTKDSVFGVTPFAMAAKADLKHIAAVVDGAEKLAAPDAAPVAEPRTTAPERAKGAFRYLFRDAAALPADPATLAALDLLAESMATEPTDPADSALPPILTYFGQFIDHDITAKTDREVDGVSIIEGDVAPADRSQIEAELDNLRDGSLGLDSLYGDSADQGDFARKLAGLMRHPVWTDKMRIGMTADSGDGRPPLPVDPAADLLRLGFLMDRGEITLEELNGLDDALRKNFLDKDGNPIRARAIIGDGRNDENLLVAQLHVAFLRLHNRLVDQVGSFEAARKLTRFHYQWLVLNEFIPSICAGDVADEVLAAGAPLYGTFFDANIPSDPAKMPMPLEFSTAAYRFGHSMVRGGYDHNRFFGTAVAGTTQLLPFATFAQLFQFTGSGGMRPNDTFPLGTSLPGNWVIEWDRLVHAETPRRAARKIDTHLAEPLNNMVNQPDGPLNIPAGMMKRLAQRNLRRGYRLNLASAQAMIDSLNALGIYRPVPKLAPEQISAGRPFLVDPGLDTATPLWFYILREAELVGGNHLGPLGSHLVANTLIGLVTKDDSSYWNATVNGHRWSPSLFRPSAPIDSLKAMLRFVGMLA